MKDTPRDFNREAAAWDDNPSRVKLAQDVADAILREIPPDSTWNALDFGCGTGLLSLPWADRVRTLTGADSAQGMLDVFAAKAARLGRTNVRTLLLDPDHGGNLAGPYDLIVSSMTLHHIREIGPLLQEFHAALAPGGRLGLADLDTEDGQFHGDNRGVFHLGFDRASLREALVAAGFAEVRLSTAAEIVKPTPAGALRTFTILLASGRCALSPDRFHLQP